MSTATDHYEQLLAPVYLWMAGGPERALQEGHDELEALALPFRAESSVVDLGAGFGLHAIPLARRGASVLAIDTSPLLLQTLDALRGALPVRLVHDDLLAFPRHLHDAPDAIFCMGDTVAHLPDAGAVQTLIAYAAAALKPGGWFVLSLRDLSVPRIGDERFVPVQADRTRLLTCFLEYEPDAVVVHDLLHEWTPAHGWTTRVSHYRKLRLAIDALVSQLQNAGFAVRREAGVRGLVRLVARRV
jgi:SAM-dependent methyltransferase